MQNWIEGYPVDDDGAIAAEPQSFLADDVIRHWRVAEEHRVKLRDGEVFAIDTREFISLLDAGPVATTPAAPGFYFIKVYCGESGLPNYTLAPVIAWRHKGENPPVAVAVGQEPDGLYNDILTPDGEVFDNLDGRHIPFAQWFARESWLARELWLDETKTIFDLMPDSPDDPIELRLPLKACDRVDHAEFESIVMLGLARLQMSQAVTAAGE